MSSILRIAVWCSLGLLAAGTSVAQRVPDEYRGPITAREQLDLLSGDLETSFHQALDSFDREIVARPFDVALQVQRCRFIEEFSYQYEYEVWIDAIFELSEACDAELAARWDNHPEVILRRFEYLYGESLLEAAAPYDYPPNRPGWTDGQLSRLYEMLALAADATGNPDAGSFARLAVEIDARASVRLIAAESLVADDMPEEALAILSSPLVPTVPADNPFDATREMALLASIGERDRLLDLYSQLKEGAEYYDAIQTARALRDVGELELARVEFASAAEAASYDTYALFERFNFELGHGTGADAMSAYEGWRATGWAADPLGANRLALFVKDPSLPLMPRDLLGLAGFVLASLIVALAALIALAPVHYRGAVIRARRQIALDAGGWRLRHAWYALFSMGMSSVLSLYFIGPVVIGPSVETDWFSAAESEQFARYFLLDGLLFLVLLLPLCRASVGLGRFRGTVAWSIPKCLLLALGIALAFRLPLVLVQLAAPDSIAELVSSSVVWEFITAVGDRYGVFVALWLLAAVAPVAEEIAFRGVLLRSFSKNVSFGLANTLQAGLFALMHFDLPATPMLFALGLVAGVLAKRSGGLLAPIVFHAAFNLIVGAFVFIPGLSG